MGPTIRDAEKQRPSACSVARLEGSRADQLQ
jgi:hypothetical protein